jgi:hypothetical protein
MNSQRMEFMKVIQAKNKIISELEKHIMYSSLSFNKHE